MSSTTGKNLCVTFDQDIYFNSDIQQVSRLEMFFLFVFFFFKSLKYCQKQDRSFP